MISTIVLIEDRVCVNASVQGLISLIGVRVGCDGDGDFPTEGAGVRGGGNVLQFAQDICPDRV